jgi:hypothetical protein
MPVFLAPLAIIPAVFVVWYAQRELTRRCGNGWACWLPRLSLLLIGSALGIVSLRINAQYPELSAPFSALDFGSLAGWFNRATRAAAFIVSLALVHFPAAAILFLKKHGSYVDHRDPLD